LEKFVTVFRGLTDDPSKLLQQLTALFLEIRKMSPDQLIALWQTLSVIEAESQHTLTAPFKKAVLQAMQDCLIEKGRIFGDQVFEMFSGATGHNFKFPK
jgi:hypothetical protein